MSEHDWRELVDDPEVTKIVEAVAHGTPPSGDPYLDDDRLSYLFERAIHTARGFDTATGVRWYAYLYSALRRDVWQQRADIYGRTDGPPGERARREAESDRVSLEGLMWPDGSDSPAPYEGWLPEPPRPDDWTGPEGRIHNPDSPGRHPWDPNDPETVLIHSGTIRTALTVARGIAGSAGLAATVTTGVCSSPGCSRPVPKTAHTRQGLCSRCYEDFRSRWGTNDKACKIGDCTRPVKGRDLCGTHYAAWRRQNPDAPECTVEGCDKPGSTAGMCANHYNQSWRDERRKAAPW